MPEISTLRETVRENLSAIYRGSQGKQAQSTAVKQEDKTNLCTAPSNGHAKSKQENSRVRQGKALTFFQNRLNRFSNDVWQPVRKRSKVLEVEAGAHEVVAVII